MTSAADNNCSITLEEHTHIYKYILSTITNNKILDENMCH